ncbi:MAG TPA: hypothetical protein VLU47_16735 [Blastocatellia bacterium]|nr:hypothetical protein [Blastocatellia bacterium]
MRTSVNLSSRPFTNHRLFWIVIAVVFLASTWFFMWAVTERSVVSAKAEQIKQRIEGQKALADAKRAEREKRESEQVKTVITEQEALELASARRLILEKSFSWNRMIAELEQIVPHEARISAIKVTGISDAEGVVTNVQVKALGATAAQMTEMMSNVAKSGGMFVVLQADQEATAETGETPFTLELTYTQTRGDAQ